MCGLNKTTFAFPTSRKLKSFLVRQIYNFTMDTFAVILKLLITIKDAIMMFSKRKNMTSHDYIELAIEHIAPLSSIERTELAGHLLKEDMENVSHRESIFNAIMSYDNINIAHTLADCIINESPEAIQDLIKELKYIVTEHYTNRIDDLIKEEKQKLSESIKLEYDIDNSVIEC